MYPIKEYKISDIDDSLALEYIDIHNQVVSDIELLLTKPISKESKEYIYNFTSKFTQVKKPTKHKIKDTIIGSRRQEIIKIHAETEEGALKNEYKVGDVQDPGYSSPLVKELGDRITKDVDAKVSLKTILLKIFNYGGNRSKLLKYFASNNYSVCSYCLVQNTVIYKSETTKKYYLTGNLDHVKPKDKDPLLSISINNLVAVCGPCNQRKSSNDFKYDPFNKDHEHSFDFEDCIDYDAKKGEVIYKTLADLKITAKKDKCTDLSKKLDYIDLYSNFENNAEVLVERYKKFSSDGYSEHLNKITDRSNSRELIDFLISEVPLTDDNVLKYSLTKFKMDLLNTIKSKSGKT